MKKKFLKIRTLRIIFFLILFFSNVANVIAVEKIPKIKSLDLGELSSPEIVLAIGDGYETVLVPTGGIEQNSLHMITGKHNYIIRWTSNEIAKRLGKTLINPILPFVPEGGFNPTTGNMTYPGTVGVTDEAYELTLEGIITSLKNTGFKNICLLADHGGSLGPHRLITEKLNKKWANENVRVVDVSKYYESGEDQIKYLQSQGYTLDDIGDHAGMLDTSELMFIYPSGVDLKKLQNNSWAKTPNGGSGKAEKSSRKIGKNLLEIKINAAVDQIKAVLQSQEKAK